VAGFSLPCGLDIGDWEWYKFRPLRRDFDILCDMIEGTREEMEQLAGIVLSS
jgi:hypothetical protein